MNKFILHSPFEPSGDQPLAIETLSKGISNNERYQTLLGVTGSGKTFTMAKIIEKTQRPALVIAHNKTLAAQLANEFKSFFPENAVEYFVSYYDYYQPEAYVPGRDLYIEKDSSINDDIDQLRHSATASLLERKDVIIVASVSCIYGLGSPIDYQEMMISLRVGGRKERDDVIRKLIEIQYERNDFDFHRGTFRVRGEVLEIYPANATENAVRIEFFDDEIESICDIHALTGKVLSKRNYITIFPASHYVTGEENIKRALITIQEELNEVAKKFNDEGKLVEAQRIVQRTHYDMEMLREIGTCKGIENYTRHINGLKPGEPPYTLLDYFPKNFITFIDESHVSVPQIGGMYAGDQSRKSNLVDYGFRLPSAKDNRPLTFDEFEERMNQIIFVSATPGSYEKAHSSVVAEQIVRPTGLLDPSVTVFSTRGQVEHLVGEINKRVERNERVLVTTLTKRMAEDLTGYLREVGIKVEYLHSDVETVERMQLIKSLRAGKFDVLVGINLLREGLDLPEVSLVAILDADKEGFLRSETSLIQTIGRAARHVNGSVIMYADNMTGSMKRAIEETNRRREKQSKYNEVHGIVPKGIEKSNENTMWAVSITDDSAEYISKKDAKRNAKEKKRSLKEEIEFLTEQMNVYARNLEFEYAAKIRDEINEIKKEMEK